MNDAVFTVGGTVQASGGVYIARPVDLELLEHCRNGDYAYVLTARQMGKSSLMVRTAERLSREGIRAVILDLTRLGATLDVDQWYLGLIDEIVEQLNLDFNYAQWWQERAHLGPTQRLSQFLRQVVLERMEAPVVIFVDEIDTTLKLEFTDDFFAAIRAAYNDRAQDSAYRRLTFVLLGVARPADLIKDRRRTPYNVGVKVDITDFVFDELGAFEKALEASYPGQGAEALRWALEWTSGQPYLTQKLCAEIAAHPRRPLSKLAVETFVEQVFFTDEARKDSNLRGIQDQIQDSPYRAGMLNVYWQVLQGKGVKDDERSVEKNELKLTGLVRATPQGLLAARNRLYARVFDPDWVRENLPVNTARRWAIAASAVAVIAFGLAAFFLYLQQTQAPDLPSLYQTQAASGDATEQVRGLGGLFLLGGNEASLALQLFAQLSPEQQLALFALPAPQDVGDELVALAEGVYQGTDGNPPSDEFLTQIRDELRQIPNTANASSLATEISDWLKARDFAARGNLEAALSYYEDVLEAYRNRRGSDKENVAARLERDALLTMQIPAGIATEVANVTPAPTAISEATPTPEPTPASFFTGEAAVAPLEPPEAERYLMFEDAPLLNRLAADTWNRFGGLLTVLAAELGIEPRVAAAVHAVETGSQGFAPNGRLLIRFENHIFWDYWGADNADLYNQYFAFDPDQRWASHLFRDDPGHDWIDFHGDQDLEWAVFDFARALNEEAALLSISMGAPQIMGFNYAEAGFASAQDMFAAYSGGDRDQVISFFFFLRGASSASQTASRRVEALQAKDFETFASLYNGPGQAAKYGGLIRLAYEAFDVLLLASAVTATPEAPTPEPPTPAPPPGPQIAFVSDRTGAPQVYLINLEDLQERQLTDLPGGACQPEWSPDGRQLLFVSPCPLGARKDELYPDAAIYVLDVDSDNLSFEPLIALLGGAFDPDWSEGGIVFTVLESNDPLNTQPRIYLADALGQPLRRLSGPNADDSQPTWSPDGGRIAFRNTSREEWDSLYWMNADGSFDGSRPGQLTFNVNVSSPAWSPDGVSLAFINRDRQRLFLVQFDNVSIGARLIFTEFPLRDPAWSPDGGWLAVEYWPDGNHDIWLIMPADPGQKQHLTSDPAEDYQPAWRP